MSRIRNQGQRKKMTVVAPFEDVSSDISPEFVSSCWSKLNSAMDALFQTSEIPYSKEDLFQTVRNLCLADSTKESTYSQLFSKLETECTSQVQKLESFQGEYHQFIQHFMAVWTQLTAQIGLIRPIFIFLERDFILPTKRARSITDLFYSIFRDTLAKVPSVENRLITDILKLIHDERTQNFDNKIVLKDSVSVLQKLSIYFSHLEPRFLGDTEEFYAADSSQKLSSLGICGHLVYAEKALQAESARISNYMNEESLGKTIEILYAKLLSEKAESSLLPGVAGLFRQNDVDSLQRMHSLLSKVNFQEKLFAEFHQALRTVGEEIVRTADKTIEQLLQLKTKVENIQKEAFQNDYGLKFKNKLAWEYFINLPAFSNKVPQLMAQDLHDRLRKSSSSKMPEEALELHVDAIIDLFRHVSNKDIFEAFYFKRLTKRILLSDSRSNDAEKSVISKLKAECGSTFTHKIHNIYKDMEKSQDLMDSFKQVRSQDMEATGIDFNVWNLTGSFWPSLVPIKVLLPPALKNLQDLYQRFYESNITKRVLHWQSSMSYCQLRAVFPSGVKFLSVSMHQALILLIFNEGDGFTIGDISRQTNIDINLLKPELVALALKYKILLKNPAKKELEETDTYKFNDKFKNKLTHLRINAVQMKEDKKENEENIERVLNERLIKIDAAIVRIMKTRKTTAHAELIREVFSQTQFSLAASHVKSRIESLIEREYLRRDDDDRTIYHYIS